MLTSTKDLTPKDIRRVARRTVEALKSCGYSSCLFGSAACHVWGMTYRTPKDIDIIVLTNDDPEVIKRKLAERNDRFIRSPSENPWMSHHLLHYAVSFQIPSIFCKVDILIPGKLDIPEMDESRREYPFQYNIPVIPFLPLLLLKLRGWVDHCNSRRDDFQAKIPHDVGDIKCLLNNLNDNDHLRNHRWLPSSLIRNSARRIRAFIQEFPDTAASWRSIGFWV
ncbi:hypothetical protein AMATHDRAFT_5538 [Amanita thiersii Skay4041]|uniref:Uncharacterized protein n=1 Tax=Amanita thiersii Skay4041 TaxID=703135 RepID=A0A2A9NKF2_9AGAR|nr:hypothetical protein AMATHDRAFT_5538 [Amanita thiersii Skay4041]